MLLRLSKVICGLMITLGLVLQPSSANGGFVTILPGYDLLTTSSGAFDIDGPGPLSPAPFVGMPLGTFNFGSGSVNVGGTDTIVQRLAPVTNLADGASQTIGVKMVALSLRSQFQIDLSAFGGIANEFVKTVNVTDLGGSSMTITNSLADLIPPAEGGTFDVTLNMSYQLQGVTSGVILGTFSKTLLTTTGSSSWTQIPTYNPILIDGVNNNLNGLDHTNDFFTGFISLSSTDGSLSHIISPEPTSMFAIGLACLAAGGRFARKRRVQQAA